VAHRLVSVPMNLGDSNLSFKVIVYLQVVCVKMANLRDKATIEH